MKPENFKAFKEEIVKYADKGFTDEALNLIFDSLVFTGAAYVRSFRIYRDIGDFNFDFEENFRSVSQLFQNPYYTAFKLSDGRFIVRKEG